MTKAPIPLTMPTKLLKEVQLVASETGLSQQEVICESVKLGLSRLRKTPCQEHAIKPFSRSESREAFAPDPDWEQLEAAMARRPASLPETD